MVQALATKVITPNMNTIIFRSSYEVERLQTCFHLPGGGDEIDQKKLVGNEHKPIVVTSIFDEFLLLVNAPFEGWTGDYIMNLQFDYEIIHCGYNMYLGDRFIGTSEY